MRNDIYHLVAGILFGIIPFGIFEVIGWNIPYLREKFYGNPKDIPTLIFGYHIHHSTLGLFSLGWGIYSLLNKSKNSFFWLGLGIGIIISHTVADRRLVFIERIK